MIYISPRKMLAARGVVQLVAKKSILTIEEEMQQRSASRKKPYPATKQRKGNLLAGFRLLRD
jgi:hypothetical protein